MVWGCGVGGAIKIPCALAMAHQYYSLGQWLVGVMMLLVAYHFASVLNAAALIFSQRLSLPLPPSPLFIASFFFQDLPPTLFQNFLYV